MVLFDGSNHTKFGGQLGEALFLRRLGKAFVHIRPFVILALGSCAQIGWGVADATQLLEPHLGVLPLIICGLQKQGRDLLIALLLRHGGKVGILVSGAGFSVESGMEVLLRLSALVFISAHFLLLLI